MRASRIESCQPSCPRDLHRQERWHWQRLASVTEMAAVIESVLAVMTKLGYSPKDAFGTRLALEEAICNAIKHGHQHDPNKTVEVRYCIRSTQVVLEVQDEGKGFDPSRIPDATAPENLERPCGRGLLLIRHYASWVQHNPKGNCVTFCIRPSEPVAAAEWELDNLLRAGARSQSEVG